MKINQQSVANWNKAYAEKLLKAKVPEKPKVAELNELFTFVEKKKST